MWTSPVCFLPLVLFVCIVSKSYRGGSAKVTSEMASHVPRHGSDCETCPSCPKPLAFGVGLFGVHAARDSAREATWTELARAVYPVVPSTPMLWSRLASAFTSMVGHGRGHTAWATSMCGGGEGRGGEGMGGRGGRGGRERQRVQDSP